MKNSRVLLFVGFVACVGLVDFLLSYLDEWIFNHCYDVPDGWTAKQGKMEE